MRKINKKCSALLRLPVSVRCWDCRWVCIFGSLVCAWLLRFEFRMPDARPALAAAPSWLWSGCGDALFNLMHGWWRYTGISDAGEYFESRSSPVRSRFLVIVRYGLGLKVFPLSIYALEALITFTLLTGVRVFSRVLAETARRDSASKRLLLVGAGHAAQMIIRETQEAKNGYRVIGCVDDDPRKRGLRVLGVPVLGPVEALARMARQAENRRSLDCDSIGHAGRDAAPGGNLQARRTRLPRRARAGRTDRRAE